MQISGGTQLQTCHLHWLDPVSQTELGAQQRFFVRTPCTPFVSFVWHLYFPHPV